jgi:WD40 repeat protein
MFGNPPMNSNGLFGKSGNNPNTMNPNVSNFNTGKTQTGTAFTFGSMPNKSGVMVGTNNGGSSLFSGSNNSTRNNLGFGGVGGGFKNLGNTGMGNQFMNNTNTSNNMFSQNTTVKPSLNYNAIDQEVKKYGFGINRDPNSMHKDTIQDMTFINLGNSNYKLVSVGWDKTLRIWNCKLEKNNMQMGMGLKMKGPISPMFCSTSLAQKVDLNVYGLKVSHVPQMNSVLIICGDCTVRRLNLTNMQVDIMISLSFLPLNIYFLQQMNVFLVITYDSKLLIYQSNNFQNPVKSVNLIATPTCSDLKENMLSIGMVDDYWSLIDINLLSQNMNILPYLKCPLESPITKVVINKANQTLIATSCDGRIINSSYKLQNQNNIPMYSTPKDVNACQKTFIFMGHGISRSKNHQNKGPSDAYNITSLNINVRNKCFTCTASADGTINFWDLIQRSKIKSIEMKESLSCGTISSDGNLGAFAIGYDWSKGIWGFQDAPQSIAICTVVFNDTDLYSIESKKKRYGN